MKQFYSHSPPLQWFCVSYHRVRQVWTKVCDLWECTLVLDLHLHPYYLTLGWSSRHVQCPLFFALFCRLPQTRVRYLKMAPSGFLRRLLRDTRGWYGGAVPVSSIWYNGWPWWRTMCPQASDNCCLPHVPIVVGLAGMTDLQVPKVPSWFWWNVLSHHHLQIFKVIYPSPFTWITPPKPSAISPFTGVVFPIKWLDQLEIVVEAWLSMPIMKES